MCGRYSLSVTPEMLGTLVNIQATLNLEPRFNIAPNQRAPVVRLTAGGCSMDMLRWGLIPSWSQGKTIASGMINARGETIAHKFSFREAYKARRCLVPVDGFYEWRKEGDTKQPFRIGFKSGAPFLLAGLWETWKAPVTAEDSGEVIESYTIITTEANEKIAPIHPRMPVIVGLGDCELWLRGATSDADHLIRAYPPDDMAFYRVSTRVNNVYNDDEGCIEPLMEAS